MKILVYGAGAIGSLFGALLSKNNEVSFIGRKPHVNYVKKYGLIIEGETLFNKKLDFYEDIKELSSIPDLVLLTVKSYDTETSAKILSSIISKETIILSFQNGLGNIENISKNISKNQIIAGITSHGSIFIKPGNIIHTGVGHTKIGEINLKNTIRIQQIVDLFNKAGITTKLSNNILEDIWKKAIVNASINPLTAIFKCKNGFLLENPILKDLVFQICSECIKISNSEGFYFDIDEMIEYTHKVITDTKENTSSMLQSVIRHKKTEISSINGTFVNAGKKNDCSVVLNEIIFKFVNKLY